MSNTQDRTNLLYFYVKILFYFDNSFVDVKNSYKMENVIGNNIIDTMTDEFTLVGKPKHFKNYKLNVLR